MTPIPGHIAAAVDALLKPYGVTCAALSEAPERRYMTPRQASVFCGLSAKTIRDKALAGEFRTVRIGEPPNGRVLVDKRDLERWLEEACRHNIN